MMMVGTQKTNVLIVDDHPVVVAGLRVLFADDAGIKISSASDYEEGLAAYRALRPNITIIDINLPGQSGLELLRTLRSDDPQAKTIIFSMNDDAAFVVRALEFGAMAYISKNDDPKLMKEAITEVLKGSTFLPPEMAKTIAFSGAAIRANPVFQLNARELEILRLLAKGEKIGVIAETLHISYKTVANTTSLLKQKIGARSHSDLIRLAVDMNL